MQMDISALRKLLIVIIFIGEKMKHEILKCRMKDCKCDCKECVLHYPKGQEFWEKLEKDLI